ncbi:MAG: archaeal proteasome endopeptidase complex subunit beta [Candidatus Thermoplasmatota archaeon]|nr:archaeal proteasome endopeptidase complex subunit beta [Candidatus Thermoplasmatota archaeon]MBU1941185.1 archaeal proteasome endopeptidase complex subunit beta [Candidatus Thermoplasmatota archaeon]
MSEELKKTGTTIMGMICKDGVVIASERRATMGTLIAHKATKKLYKIDEHLALATAGLVGDLQVLSRYLSAEVNLYRLKRGNRIPVNSAATLMSNILNQRKFYPYYVQLILGGWDTSGGHVYSLDAAGGAIPDKYTAGGSGSPYVFGVLEDLYRDDLTVDEGVEIAIRAVTAAMGRDSASGNGIDIAIIDEHNFKILTDEEVKSRKEKIVK